MLRHYLALTAGQDLKAGLLVCPAICVLLHSYSVAGWGCTTWQRLSPIYAPKCAASKRHSMPRYDVARNRLI